MQCNGNFKQWFNIFLIISEAWQGYESKAYGVSNHNLKLQSKKLSRTRDIPNFPTQGWADTAFCTRNWSETYMYVNLLNAKKKVESWIQKTSVVTMQSGENSRNSGNVWEFLDKKKVVILWNGGTKSELFTCRKSLDFKWIALLLLISNLRVCSLNNL